MLMMNDDSDDDGDDDGDDGDDEYDMTISMCTCIDQHAK